MGPKGLPDWIIFLEKCYKDEGFKCAFSMNPKLQAPRPIGSTCPAAGMGHGKTDVICGVLGLSHIRREFRNCEILALVLDIPICFAEQISMTY